MVEFGEIGDARLTLVATGPDGSRIEREWPFTVRAAQAVQTFAETKALAPGAKLALGADPPGHKETRLAFGMGRTVRNCDERCIIARRGKPEVASHSVRSVFFAPAGRHSEKPSRFFRLAEQLCGPGPRAELFARERRRGWTGFGDEIPAAGQHRPDRSAQSFGKADRNTVHFGADAGGGAGHDNGFSLQAHGFP